ncbi:MAG: biopolymer transporter ExbD [Planctomycetes bacterium]|nr:biopolymer transporter ExbD [Planctomycetota bacterium]
MASKSRVQQDPEPKLDLTPMIDIVFNLIIFFMIVSDMSNLDMEEIALPFADQAQKAEGAKGGDEITRTIVVNILSSGKIRIRGKDMNADPTQKASGNMWLGDYFRTEVAGYKVEPADENGVKASALEVNIRSDRGAPFKYVQQVFDACIGYPNETPRAPIYKTSLAASPDKKE